MKKKAEAVNQYNFQSSDQLLLDTNIWLFLYGPQSPKNNPKVGIYSQAFNKILQAKSHIYIDALIVSEFINRYARIRQDLISSKVSFKRFRQSPEFQAIASDIVADVKRVLRHCIQIECDFETLAMDDLLDEFKTGNFDFNDQVLTALCKKRKLKLVTDDGDFDTAEISVLTANIALLK